MDDLLSPFLFGPLFAKNHEAALTDNRKAVRRVPIAKVSPYCYWLICSPHVELLLLSREALEMLLQSRALVVWKRLYLILWVGEIVVRSKN